MHACMSSLGGGKTTLLNTLSLRLDKNLQLAGGEMLLNGQPYSQSHLKNTVAYITQDDLLNANLTVEETLRYAAYLKMPASLTQEAKHARVSEVIDLMGLQAIKDNLVGQPDKRGISGGERKRLCVGVAIINKPKLIFADESTSGLDCVASSLLIQLCRRLTRVEGTTILMTIHQPKTAIFRMFDGLILMKKGQVVYSGTIPGALSTFEQFGFPCEKFNNPADHLLDVLAEVHQVPDGLIQPGSGLPESGTLDERLIQVQKDKISAVLAKQTELLKANQAKNERLHAEAEEIGKNRLTWSGQLRVLISRAFRDFLNNRFWFFVSLFQGLAMATLIGTVFLRLDRDAAMASRRSAVIFFCCVNQGIFGSLTTIQSFPAERALVLRERASGFYKASSYFLAKSIVDAIPQITVPVCFSILIYYVIGLRPEAGPFFLFMLFMILCSLAATSLSLMVACICKTSALTVVVLPGLLEISRLYGGFFLAPTSLPDYFSWLDALSYLKYSYVGASLNEFDDPTYPAGLARIKTLGLDYISIGGCIGSLIAYIIGTRFIAYLAVRYLKQ